MSDLISESKVLLSENFGLKEFLNFSSSLTPPLAFSGGSDADADVVSSFSVMSGSSSLVTEVFGEAFASESSEAPICC